MTFEKGRHLKFRGPALYFTTLPYLLNKCLLYVRCIVALYADFMAPPDIVRSLTGPSEICQLISDTLQEYVPLVSDVHWAFNESNSMSLVVDYLTSCFSSSGFLLMSCGVVGIALVVFPLLCGLTDSKHVPFQLHPRF